MSTGKWCKMMRYHFFGTFLNCSQSRTRIQKSGLVNPRPKTTRFARWGGVNLSTFLNSRSWLATKQKWASKTISHHFSSFTSRQITDQAILQDTFGYLVTYLCNRGSCNVLVNIAWVAQFRHFVSLPQQVSRQTTRHPEKQRLWRSFQG